MINKESNILYVMAKMPIKKYTFKELQESSKKRSKSYLDLVLKKYIKKGIIKSELIGNVRLYQVNLNLIKSRVYLGFVLEYYGWNQKNIPYEILNNLTDKLPLTNYTLIITGSYVSKKQSPNSDLDIALIVEDSTDVKKIYAELNHYCQISIPQIHLLVFKNKEFIEMLCNKEANYGKEIVKNYLILHGGESYLKLLLEAKNNGFTG